MTVCSSLGQALALYNMVITLGVSNKTKNCPGSCNTLHDASCQFTVRRCTQGALVTHDLVSTHFKLHHQVVQHASTTALLRTKSIQSESLKHK